MQTKKNDYKETITVLCGQAVCVAVMCLVYFLVDRFSMKVLLGGVMGALLATGNFFVMSMAVYKAADKAEQQDVAGGQKLIQLSYTGRLAGLLIALILCAKSGWFDLLALVLPLAFTRPILTLWELAVKKGGKAA